MDPVLGLLLLLVTVTSQSSDSSRDSSTGLKFFVAFPENVAYFHPNKSENKVKITALYDNTLVRFTTWKDAVKTMTLQSGQTKEYQSHPSFAFWRSRISKKVLQIKSNHSITVSVINMKGPSVQTAVVTAADKLGTEYLVPPVPVITGTTHPAGSVTTAVTENGPFKLIIINTDAQNTVTVVGAGSKSVSLKPREMTQFWVQQQDKLRAVKADQPVAVLFGHTCAMRQDCTCGQLFTTLPPTHEGEQKFYVPPALAKDAEDETLVLLSGKESTNVKRFSPKSPLVKTAGSAILYRPGLLLPLIPETEFAACFVVNSVKDALNSAVIVVHKDLTDGVHVGDRPLDSPEWRQLEGTKYVSTTVALTLHNNFIWHAKSTMAVYLMGNKEGILFGNPASVISKSPDFRGCVLSPEVVEIGKVADGWRESIKHCRDNKLELVSFPEAQLQTQISNKIQAKSPSLKKVWIGMRRSSLTGEWYWLNKEPVTDTNWAPGEPGTVQDGQCAIMSLEKSQKFAWSDEDCCMEAYPVCYKEPVLFPPLGTNQGPVLPTASGKDPSQG